MIALVSCSGPKLDHPAPARILYTSPLFRAASTYAQRHHERWGILSGLYGLVLPDEQIEPYDVDLSSFGKARRMEWGDTVRDQLRRMGTADDLFVILAGKAYREPLEPHLNTKAHPTNGLRLGEALQWYRRNP